MTMLHAEWQWSPIWTKQLSSYDPQTCPPPVWQHTMLVSCPSLCLQPQRIMEHVVLGGAPNILGMFEDRLNVCIGMMMRLLRKWLHTTICLKPFCGCPRYLIVASYRYGLPKLTFFVMPAFVLVLYCRLEMFLSVLAYTVVSCNNCSVLVRKLIVVFSIYGISVHFFNILVHLPLRILLVLHLHT